MTALNNPVVFNEGTGTDTEASGSGPATAVFGTNGTTSGTTLSGITVTGVNIGDLAWANVSTGRQFSRITAVGASDVTVETAFGANESSLTWAIGGTRSTFENSRQLFQDLEAAWIVETETTQTLSAPKVIVNGIATTSAPAIIRGASGAIRTIAQTGNDHAFAIHGTTLDDIRFENLFITFSGTGSFAAFSRDDGAGTSLTIRLHLIGCYIDSTWTYGIRATGSTNRLIQISMEDSTISGCSQEGIDYDTFGGGQIYMLGSMIHGCGADGIFGNTTQGVFIFNSVIGSNGGSGIDWARGPLSISNSTIANNGNGGLFWRDGVNNSVILANNIISNNLSVYGINGNFVAQESVNYNNVYFGNTSGPIAPSVTLRLGGKVSTTVDPELVNAAAGNYAIGPNVAGLGTPGDFSSGLSTGYLDPGAVQRQEGGGPGGGLLTHPGMTGGIRG